MENAWLIPLVALALVNVVCGMNEGGGGGGGGGATGGSAADSPPPPHEASNAGANEISNAIRADFDSCESWIGLVIEYFTSWPEYYTCEQAKFAVGKLRAHHCDV